MSDLAPDLAGATAPAAHDALVVLSSAALGEDRGGDRQQLLHEIGLFEPAEGGVRLRSPDDDLDWFARQLCAAPFDAEIAGPDALRASVAALAGRIRQIAGALCAF